MRENIWRGEGVGTAEKNYEKNPCVLYLDCGAGECFSQHPHLLGSYRGPGSFRVSPLSSPLHTCGVAVIAPILQT